MFKSLSGADHGFDFAECLSEVRYKWFPFIFTEQMIIQEHYDLFVGIYNQFTAISRLNNTIT